MKRKISEKKALKILGLLLAIAGINIVASFIHIRFDLTEEKRYSLSRATRNLLNKLEDPLDIKVFLEGEIPAEFRKLSNATADFLRILKDAKSAKIQYDFIDPTDETGDGKLWADSLNIFGVTIFSNSNDLLYFG